jgi:ABC-type iron transport system FetAB ATPase subunit
MKPIASRLSVLILRSKPSPRRGKRGVRIWDSLDCGQGKKFADAGRAAEDKEILMEAAFLVKGLRSAFAGPFELDLGAGACAAITGPSGSGKSLFLRMIADLDPNQGDVWLNGKERASMPAPAWRKQAIYVSAESGWWADRVIEHFATGSQSDAATLAARLGLRDNVLNAPVSQLSTGEKQRLSLARALLLNPRVLLLDEPTGSLDEESVTRVEAVLQERMANGTSILLVTHDPKQAARLGSQHYHMMAGHLVTA